MKIITKFQERSRHLFPAINQSSFKPNILSNSRASFSTFSELSETTQSKPPTSSSPNFQLFSKEIKKIPQIFQRIGKRLKVLNYHPISGSFSAL
jgi:hypothetical protein